jgi:hypothetical protein
MIGKREAKDAFDSFVIPAKERVKKSAMPKNSLAPAPCGKG